MSALEVNRDVWREHVEQQSPEICARRHGLFELIDEAVRVKVRNRGATKQPGDTAAASAARTTARSVLGNRASLLE